MASKKTSAAKTTAAKTAAAKTAAPANTAQKDVKTTVYIEYGSGKTDVQSIINDVMTANTAENGAAPENVEIYIKPEEKVAYYVINGKSEGKCVGLDL